MNAKNAAAAMRAVADLLDRGDFPDDWNNFRVDLRCYWVNDIELLKNIAALMEKSPIAKSRKGTYWINGERSGVNITAFYEAGLLGRTRKKRVVERTFEVETDVSVLVSAD